MSGIDTLLLTNLLSSGIAEQGIPADVMETEAVSSVLGQLCDAINQQVTQLQGKVQQNQQQAAETNKDVQQLIKVGKALTDALADKSSPQPLPQQDMNAEPAPVEQPLMEQPPIEQPPADMVSPPEMNIPPAPDMSMATPTEGIQPPEPNMTQIDPNMLGALQQGY